MFLLYELGYGGLDRNTDGTYGYENVAEAHRLLEEGKILLSTEGCNCPGVSWNDWIRAERLGHDIIFDMNNFAQGWIDWNLLLDFEGGPNHKGNLCDASIIASPDYSDIHIQPKFHYFGHFSKFITPDSVRIHTAIVGNYMYTDTDPSIQPAIEVGFFPCEKSSRQMWKLDDNKMKLARPSISEYTNTSMELCIGYGDSNRLFLRLLACDEPVVSLIRPHFTNKAQIVDLNTGLCLQVEGTANQYGGLVQLKPCGIGKSSKGLFELTKQGEVKTVDNGYCLTAGWPFLTSTAAITPTGETAVVVMNEADISTKLLITDTNIKSSFTMQLEPRSMVTINY